MPQSLVSRSFDPHCRRCPRLVHHLERMRAAYPGYHCAPVATWGEPSARLLIVGLAPGLHGANRTGRPFTGDASGTTLIDSLCAMGFARRSDRGVVLQGCRITNAIRCLPPGNRPAMVEVRACNPYLVHDIDVLAPPGIRKPRVVVALGRIAFAAATRALSLDRPPRFSHGIAVEASPRRWLLASYHPSRLNVNTGRLTQRMLDDVFCRAAALLA